jgi:hypothetical protein
VAHPLWRKAEEMFLSRLDAVTMEELCADAERQGVARAGEAPRDFAI